MMGDGFFRDLGRGLKYDFVGNELKC